MKLKTYISRLCAVLITVLVVASGMKAQTFMHYNAALSYLQRGEVDSARVEIDLHMKELGSDKDPDSWYLCGFVYKEMYKKYEGTNPQSVHRMTALGAFEKSLALDTVAARMKLTRDNVNNKKNNDAYFEITRDTYLKVLSLEPNNYMANYNLGLLYWNKGVDLMYDIDYDDSLGVVFDIQDFSVQLFKQSLPFAEKAFELEPKREETLIVLSGIYYSLNEFDKSKAYQQMLDDLRKQK